MQMSQKMEESEDLDEVLGAHYGHNHLEEQKQVLSEEGVIGFLRKNKRNQRRQH